MYCEVFRVDDEAVVGELLASLAADPRVEMAQPMNLFRTLTNAYNDPLVDLQAGLAELDIEGAHQWSTGRGVTVAIIDSGVDKRHPELQGRITVSRDFVNGDTSSSVAEIHGTAVAGIIASAADNQQHRVHQGQTDAQDG